jgi:hypothetical protein
MDRAAHLHHLGFDVHTRADLFGHRPSGHKAQSEPAREMTSATGVCKSLVFDACREVGMTWARLFLQCLIVCRPCIVVAENDGDGRTGGMPIVYATQKIGQIVLCARGGPFGATLSARKVGQKVCLAEWDAGRTPVNGDADRGPMRLTENMDPE